MLIKPDKIIVSSFTEPYINYATVPKNLTISGSVADGNTATFISIVPLTVKNTLSDVYVTNQNTGIKMPVNSGGRVNPYQAVSTETSSVYAKLTGAGSSITVYVEISNNTGGPINLTTQVWTVSVVLYSVPY